MIFTLPMPPGINRTYKVGRGKLYKSEEAKQWQHDAFFLIKKERFQRRKYKTRVILSMIGKKGKKWDIDMGIKIILDTLVMAGLFKDDSEILFVDIAKFFTDQKPYISLTL